jgi:hypothetical protein
VSCRIAIGSGYGLVVVILYLSRLFRFVLRFTVVYCASS